MAKEAQPPVQDNPADTVQALRAVLWLLIGALAGAMVANLPLYTSLWGIVACGSALLLSHLWRRVGSKARPFAIVVAVVVFGFCVFKAYREYIGANYRLK